MVKKGETYTVQCGGYSSDGIPVARIDGLAVFVKGALRGETCRVEIEHVGHSAAWARVVELTAPSPARIAPDCPHYPLCGGCHLRHMTYAEELDFKRQKVTDALRRIGGLDLTVEVIHPAPALDGCRNKAQLPVAPGPKIGYYQARSHRVVDAPACALQPPWCAHLRRGLLDYMTRYNVPAYDETARSGLIRHLYVRGNARGQTLCAIVSAKPRLPHEDALASLLRAAEPGLTGLVLNHNGRDTNVILGPSSRLLWGQDFLEDTLRGLTFRLSVPSFYQVNRDQAETLYGLVAQFAALTGTERVLDLYCGAGTIGLTLAHDARELLGVELVPEAVRDAEENAARNGIANARFLCSDASQAARALAAQGAQVDVAVVDPPRKGLAPEGIAALLTIAPKKLIYVSCDPATLARDLKLLSPAYTPRRVECVDMFPRTHHVETVVSLTRAP